MVARAQGGTAEDMETANIEALRDKKADSFCMTRVS